MTTPHHTAPHHTAKSPEVRPQDDLLEQMQRFSDQMNQRLEGLELRVTELEELLKRLGMVRR